MTARKGTISVQTNDIFPIIKKWLYSEHDIFLRELISNGTDAITKRATLSRNENLEVPTGKVSVTVNKTEKTITIEDNGLGMTEEEVEKYLAQLAFSGATEFVEKMKASGAESGADIIGKFGLGFYSAFMVSEKVVVESLSYKPGSTPTKWTCEGNPEYEFSESTKSEPGTKITLHINEENDEFLNEYKISSTLRKFCDFMPYEISVLDEEAEPIKPRKEDGSIDEDAPAEAVKPTVINNTEPLWKKDPSTLKDEDYISFFRHLFPMDPEPLFWIHLNVDHPFHLQGILYFPKIDLKKPVQDKNIRLYNKQVFVSDNVKEIIPDFLGLLKGTIDSTDIPLNVSRSSLQGDPNIRKISNYIIKKVADALKVLFKKDREKYESIWPDIGLFVKYGCVSDNKFDELMRPRVLFKTEKDTFLTIDEYRESIPADYKEKLKETVLYFEKDKYNAAMRTQLSEKGIHSVEIDEYIDPHFTQHVETQKQGDNATHFRMMESEYGNIFQSESVDENDTKIKDLFMKYLGIKEDDKQPGDLELELEKVTGDTAPAYMKTDEQMKRFARMAESMGQNNKFPVKKTLVLNPANGLVQNAFRIHESGKHEKLVEQICLHVNDLAKISSEGLEQDQRDAFVKRSQELIKDLSSLAL